MAMMSTQNLPTEWMVWIARTRGMLDIAEPVLERLVEIREESWWVKLPVLRRLRPPSEVVVLLDLVRKLRAAL
jgi:hypothetical protein